jgi:hypothetical protein
MDTIRERRDGYGQEGGQRYYDVTTCMTYHNDRLARYRTKAVAVVSGSVDQKHLVVVPSCYHSCFDCRGGGLGRNA